MDWQTVRNRFMRATGGDPPGAHLEDDIIAAFAQHPDAVVKSMEKIVLGYKAGRIRSPWGALKHEVAKAADAANNPTVDRAHTRANAIQRAEQWMRTAGLHHDRESELIDELYGERGRLRDHPETQERMLALWNELRPLGEEADQDAIDRGLRYQQQRAAQKNARAATTMETK